MSERHDDSHKDSYNFHIPFLSSKEVRKAFMDFYGKHHHKVLPSSPLVLPNDPSTLFINSGMMPFKSIFLGHNPQNLSRVCNTQKVLRVSGKHNDLDEVGLDDYHHTFFEMLGHWSFGDYFKKETILLGWELMTEVYKFPKNRLFVTVHHSDDEAYELWCKETDIEQHRILRFDKDNFWEMAATGPCGTCSEIHFDRGDIHSQKATYNHPIHGVNGKGHRYVELINFVFIAFQKLSDGGLQPLKEKHVDTGAGLERLCAILQGQASNYETDLFKPLTHHIATLLNAPYHKGEKGTPHRVISDHIRAVSFAIADGVHFSNEGRGYVIRRILRRALRYGHKIGLKTPTLFHLVDPLSTIMGTTFPELAERQDFIKEMIHNEEEQFLKTLRKGLNKLEEIMANIAATKTAKQPATIHGRDVFTLYDTYGFPIDLTAQVAREHSLRIDEDGYHKAMLEQKNRAKKAQMFTDLNKDNWTYLSEDKTTTFCGYTTLEYPDAQTLAMRQDSKDGNMYHCILKTTPFYPTSGGQKGDKGWLKNDLLTFEVTSTDYHMEHIMHTCVLKKGQPSHNFQECGTFYAMVNKQYRRRTAQHHSTTHLLHAALKKHFSEDITQRGAYYDEHILRFDFSFPRALTTKDLHYLENTLNTTIRDALPVTVENMPLALAKASGALTFAGESYGEEVRVLTMQDSNNADQWVSKELCGGTHVHNTGSIGIMIILSESAVAAGIRRITAKAGDAAYEYIKLQQRELYSIYQTFSVPFSTKTYLETLKHTTPSTDKKPQASPSDQLPALSYAKTLKEKSTHQETIIKKLNRERIEGLAATIKEDTQTHTHGHHIIAHDVTYLAWDNTLLTELSAKITQNHHESFIACLYTYNKQAKPNTTQSTANITLFVSVSTALQPTWHAGKLVSYLCKQWQGRGGGRPDRAKGGIKEYSSSSASFKKALTEHIYEYNATNKTSTS
ncbi:MAG: alanine--tRNA ligase [Proteobacteria bacterium]|nr:alanine--tRNA ligase [Pseudomonadota bacterium]